MTSEPVSKLPDPKYAIEDRMDRKYVPVSDLSGDGFGVDPDCAEAAATLRVLRADLRTALAQLEEARAERDANRAHIRAQASDVMTLGALVYADEHTTWKARAEAAEARLEELTRERDEAKAEVARYWTSADMTPWIEALERIDLAHFGKKLKGMFTRAMTAEADARVAWQAVERVEAERDEATVRLEDAKAVLAFYGEEDRYDYDNDCCFDPPGTKKHHRALMSSGGDILQDRGEKARAFLRQGGSDAR